MIVNLQIYINKRVGLFTTMLTGLGRKHWRGGFRERYSGKNINFGITKEIDIPGIN